MHSPPPPDTVLRRAPRSLGSALVTGDLFGWFPALVWGPDNSDALLKIVSTVLNACLHAFGWESVIRASGETDQVSNVLSITARMKCITEHILWGAAALTSGHNTNHSFHFSLIFLHTADAHRRKCYCSEVAFYCSGAAWLNRTSGFKLSSIKESYDFRRLSSTVKCKISNI